MMMSRSYIPFEGSNNFRKSGVCFDRERNLNIRKMYSTKLEKLVMVVPLS